MTYIFQQVDEHEPTYQRLLKGKRKCRCRETQFYSTYIALKI